MINYCFEIRNKKYNYLPKISKNKIKKELKKKINYPE